MFSGMEGCVFAAKDETVDLPTRLLTWGIASWEFQVGHGKVSEFRLNFQVLAAHSITSTTSTYRLMYGYNPGTNPREITTGDQM